MDSDIDDDLEFDPVGLLDNDLDFGPIALREYDIKDDTLQTDEEVFLQAAILDQSNEEKYKKELDHVLALSLLDSEEFCLDSLITRNQDRHLKKPTEKKWTDDFWDGTQHHIKNLASKNLEMDGDDDTQTTSACSLESVVPSNCGPQAMARERSNNNFHDKNNDVADSVDSFSIRVSQKSRRRSLDRLQDLNQAAGLGECVTSDTKEEDYSREVAELIKMGIIKPDQVSEKFRPRVEQNLLGSDASKSDQACAVVPPTSHTLNSNNTSTVPTYKINNTEISDDFQNLCENNVGIETLKLVPFTADNALENWTRNNDDEHGSVHIYKLVSLSAGCLEYNAIVCDFKNSGLIVKSIERLQNGYLLEKFKSEQDQILKSRLPGFDVNCRYLYHGTPADKDRISEEGLDARLSRMGCFGKGIYFSDNPRKCIQYTGMGKQYEIILMCRVILGDTKVYASGATDSNLRREPEKEEPTGGWRYYDSVSGQPIDFNEFVVYENRRAMIEYIITYTTDPNGTVNTSSTQSSSNSQPFQQTNVTEEQHMEIIEIVRESVRKQRCLDQGEVWKEPSKAEKDADRKKWKSIVKLSCPEGGQVWNKSGASNSLIQPGGASNYKRTEELDPEKAAINEVMSNLICDFLQVTNIDDVQKARTFLERANMDLNSAIEMFYANMTFD